MPTSIAKVRSQRAGHTDQQTSRTEQPIVYTECSINTFQNEDSNLRTHSRENLKSYTFQNVCSGYCMLKTEQHTMMHTGSKALNYISSKKLRNTTKQYYFDKSDMRLSCQQPIRTFLMLTNYKAGSDVNKPTTKCSVQCSHCHTISSASCISGTTVTLKLNTGVTCCSKATQKVLEIVM
jgi:hypothetical protein